MRETTFVFVSILLLLANIAAIGVSGRERAKESVCRSNVSKLSEAWLRYAQDHGGNLVGGDTRSGNWVTVPSTSGVREQELDAIKRGLLFPYVGDVRLYHCPSQSTQASPMPTGWRSFVIAGGANGESWSGYQKATTYSDLKDPSTRYIFVESPSVRGILMGSWQMNLKAPAWVDPVAMWHNRKSVFGFADGHAGTHAWQDPSCIKWNLNAMYSPGSFTFGMAPPAEEQNDISYMAKGFPYKSLR